MVCDSCFNNFLNYISSSNKPGCTSLDGWRDSFEKQTWSALHSNPNLQISSPSTKSTNYNKTYTNRQQREREGRGQIIKARSNAVYLFWDLFTDSIREGCASIISQRQCIPEHALDQHHTGTLELRRVEVVDTLHQHHTGLRQVSNSSMGTHTGSTSHPLG